MKLRAADRTAFDTYRRLAGPSAPTRTRMLEALLQRTARGDLPDMEIAPPRPLPLVSGLRKRLVAAGALIGTAVLLVLAWQFSTAAPAPGVGTATPPQPTAAAASAPVPESSAAAEPTAPTTASAATRTLAVRDTDKRAAHGSQGTTRTSRANSSAKSERPQASSPTAEPAQGAQKRWELEEEFRLVRGAYDQLRTGAPESALALLVEHATRFPRGQLAASRQVARIMALCQTGERTAAQAEAASFLRASPASPYAARVRSLCVDPHPGHRP